MHFLRQRWPDKCGGSEWNWRFIKVGMMHPQKNYVAAKLKALRTLQSKLQTSTFDPCNPSTHSEEKWREVGAWVSSRMTTIVCTLLTNTDLMRSKRSECWQNLQMIERVLNLMCGSILVFFCRRNEKRERQGRRQTDRKQYADTMPD